MLLVFVTLVLVINALVGERGLMETLRARRSTRSWSASIERLRPRKRPSPRDEAGGFAPTPAP